MTTFTQFVQTKALQDHLPFGIDFDIKPEFGNCETVEIAGFNIPVFNELLSREEWFFELLNSANTERRTEVEGQLRALSIELQKACNMPTLKEAFEALFTPSDELAEDPAYQDFYYRNLDKINKILELMKLLQDDRALAWLKVSFFMLSRVDATWTLGQSTQLRSSQINDILRFIIKEANNGIDPEAVALPQSDGVETAEGKEGTVEPPAKIGGKSTGKSQPSA